MRCRRRWRTRRHPGWSWSMSTEGRRFVLFVLAGGTAALANFGSRIGLSLVMPYVPAIVVAYCIGMLTAFVLNRAFVFTDAGTRMRHQVFWFVVVNLLAVAQTLAIS